jgi:gluconate 2-dehydrogenase alpha chain
MFDKPLNRFMGSGANGVMISDLDADNFDHTPLDFIGGARAVAGNSGARPIANFGAVPSSVTSNWGSAWKKAAIESFDRVAGLGGIGEHPAYRGNYMDLDPTYRDQNGDPLLRMTLDYTDNERKLSSYINAKLAEIGHAMGATEVTPGEELRRYDVVHYKGTHIQGGTIMGASPENSVLNPWLQHWQMPNLFVLGASAMPQNPSGNPTLTLIALTMRTADALVDRYLKNPGSLT